MSMAYSSGYDLNNLKQSLFRKQTQVNEAVIRAVEEGAQKIIEEAQKRVPIDTHNLESAIHIEERRTRRGNHAIDIVVSGVGSDGRDVASYALLIEEMYDFYVAEGRWSGKGAKLKEMESGERAGSFYMKRGVEAAKPQVIDNIRQAIRAAVK